MFVAKCRCCRQQTLGYQQLSSPPLSFTSTSARPLLAFHPQGEELSFQILPSLPYISLQDTPNTRPHIDTHTLQIPALHDRRSLHASRFHSKVASLPTCSCLPPTHTAVCLPYIQLCLPPAHSCLPASHSVKPTCHTYSCLPAARTAVYLPHIQLSTYRPHSCLPATGTGGWSGRERTRENHPYTKRDVRAGWRCSRAEHRAGGDTSHLAGDNP